MNVNKSIDWLSISMLGIELEGLPMNEGFEAIEEMPKPRFYDRMWRLRCGGTFAHSDDDRQGSLLTLSGDPLRWFRDAEANDAYLLAVLSPLARKYTRIDYAIDVIGSDDFAHTPNAVYSAHKRGKIVTRMKPSKSIKDLNVAGGRSIYWGSPKSDVRLRVYDKAAEMKLLNEAWLRVELQVRGDQAHALAGDMRGGKISRAGDAKLKKVFCPAEGHWLRDIIEDDNPPTLTEVPRKETNFSRWVRSTVWPSFRKHMQDKQDRVVVGEFLEMLGREWFEGGR